MAGKIKGLTVEIDGNTTKLSKAIATVNTQSSKLRGELRGVDKLLKFDPKNTVLLTQKQKLLNDQIELQASKLDDLRKKEEAYAKDKDSFTDEQLADYRNLQREIVATEKNLQAAKRALAEFNIEQGVSNSAIGRLGAGIESFGGKIKPAGQMIESMGGTLTRTLTPAIVGVGAASVAAAVTIDSSLTNVKKTVDGTDEQYQQLKESAIEFSQTNAVSASQILDIQSLGAQLGFAIDELDEFGRVVSGLDIATNMDAEQAATEMAQFANITKMSHGDISNYGSAIVGLGNSFATTESDISSMAMRIAASGTQVGMSQADILGLATALSSMGVEAEAGGTAVSTIMAQIDKDIATNSASVETWASTAGMSAQQFADAWKNDPVTALSALLSNMESATVEGGNMSVMLDELGISSIRQTDIMKRLAGNSGLVGEAVAKSNEEWAANTALQAEVDNRNASLASQFEILKNRVIAMADQVGGPLAAALLDVIDAAEPLIQVIADGAKQFSEMSKSEQQAVLKAVALSAALGPMLNVFGKGMQQVEGFGKGLQKVAKFLATVDFKTSAAGRAVKDYGSAAKDSESATKKQAATVKASSVAMGAAKTMAMGLAGVLATVLLGAVLSVAHGMAESKKRSDEMKASNRELSSSLDGLEPSASAATSSLDGYGVTAESVKGRADDLKQAHDDLAQSLTDTMTEAGSTAGMLDSYMGVIEELGTKSDLTKEEQARLKDAVDKVNEACGTSFQMTNDANGALYGQVDAIRAVISARQDQLRYEAASEGLKDLYKQQEADLMRISELEQQRSDLLEKHKGQTKAQWGEDAEVYNETVSALNEAQSQYNATSDAVERYEGRIGELGSAMGSSKDEIAAFVASSESLASVFASTGQSADGFSEALSKCGVSTADLESLSADKLAAIAQSYDGNIQSIVGLLQEFGIAAKEEGAEAAEGYADGLSEGADAAVSAAAEVAGKSVDEIKAECDQFGIEGDEAVKAYADAIASGKSQAEAAAEALGISVVEGVESKAPEAKNAVLTMRNGMLQAYDPITGEVSDLTFATMQAINQNVVDGQPLAIQSVDDVATGMVTAFNPLTQSFEQISLSAVQTAEGTIRQGEPGFTEAVNLMKNNGTGTLQLIEGEWRLVGENATSNLGGGMAESQWKVDDAVNTASNKVGELSGAGDGSWYWGRHLIDNFSGGIWSGVHTTLSSAVNGVVSAISDNIKFSEPKKGPLRRLDRSGRHMVQNFVRGIRDEMPGLEKAVDELSETAATGFEAAVAKPGGLRVAFESVSAPTHSSRREAPQASASARFADPQAIASRSGVTVTVEQPASTRTEVNYYVTVDARDLAGASAVGDVIRVFERAKRANPTRTRR